MDATDLGNDDEPTLDDIPAVVGDVPGWEVTGTRSLDGWVTIEIFELTEEDLCGQPPGEQPA